jgi:cytoskeletal protein RodZ
MDSFGEKLRIVREECGLSIEAVSERIGADRDQLLALERNDFQRVPHSHPVMMETLQAYAVCLDVEADLLIEEYVREREKCLEKLEGAVSAQLAAETTPSAVPSAVDRPSRVPRTLLVCGVLLTVVSLGAWWMRSGSEAWTVAPQPASEPTLIESPPPRPVAAPAVEETSPPAVPTQTQPTRDEVPVEVTSSRPSIPEYAVGIAVEDRQLVGEGSRFSKETQVWFWTRVDDANPGDRIDHVWLHEGVEAATVSLKIGGPRWRTYSAKMLHSEGSWTVEARDQAGHVLARSEFVCTD